MSAIFTPGGIGIDLPGHADQGDAGLVGGGNDLISMLVHSDKTKDMINDPMTYLGNILLLIIGGNDTTRNTMTGSVYGLHKFPENFEKLKADPSLIEKFVPEVIRWQTPLAYMRRTATKDTVLNGKEIKKDGAGAFLVK